jgi:hypothetical protein
MEFSYKVSEQEYAEAWKLKQKGGSRSAILRAVMFWVFILVCLMLLWSVVNRSSQTAPVVDSPPPTSPADTSSSRALLANIGPFLAVAAVWCFLLFGFRPILMRRRYRKDPSMQGQFTVDITPVSMSTTNTVGTSSTIGWNVCEFWREGKIVIILSFHSGAYFILGLTELSEARRAELRDILQAALPKK